MKKYVITAEEVSNNEYGDAESSVYKTGILTAESRWDALKKARAVCKEEARDWCIYNAIDDTGTFWINDNRSMCIGFAVSKKEWGCSSHEVLEIRVKIHDLKPSADGIEWEVL